MACRVLFILSVCVLVSLFKVATGKIPYDIFRLEGNQTAYLILNGVAKAIADDDTVTTLGYTPANLVSISVPELAKYAVGESISRIAKTDGSPDDITRMEWLKALAVNGRLLYDIHYIGEYMNPAVVKWRDRLLLATGSNGGRANTKTTKSAFLEFRWYNHKFLPFQDTGTYVGITPNEVEMLDKEAYGEDPRIVVVDDNRLFVFYAYPFQALTRIGMIEVVVHPTTHVAQIVTLHQSIHPVLDFSMRHKNWAPFQARNGDILLIQNLNPFIVVKPTLRDDGLMYAEVVSNTPAVFIHWPYGTLRGGTNAVYIPEKDAYLAFFHSKSTFAGSYMFSYVAGAYTFSAQAPYRLLTVSPMPIMTEQFYTGPWSPLKNARIDYCFFPTAIYLEGSEIVMSAGFQDHSGYLMKLNLRKLLNTMVAVE